MASERTALKGLNVVFFESRHSKTLGDLIALQGGVPCAAPAMKEVPLENNSQVFDFADKLLEGEIDVLIFLTGVGARLLVSVLETRYSRKQIFDALKKISIVPRGPKPVRVLNEWAIPYTLTVPEPNTWRELLQALDSAREKIPLSRKTVAVQEYGVSNPELLAGLRERGARLLSVPVYRWALPDDLNPLMQAITKMVSGQIHVALFTTAAQIDHVFQVAKKMKLEDTLKQAFGKIVVASVGPDCSQALKHHGLSVDIQPQSPKMGPLVLETAQCAQQSLQAKQKTIIVLSPVSEQIHLQADALAQSIFLKACRREKTPYTPVWLMRQAGRYMKDYRVLREKMTFLQLCKNASLAAEITVTAQEKLRTDAAIIFSDILLILEPMGLSLDYLKADGPCIGKTIRDSKSVETLKEVDATQSLSFVCQAIREARKKLKNNIPLIGFAGAPFTLASYMIEGGSTQDFSETKKFMQADRSRWEMLMKKIVRSTASYLNAQIDAGAQAIQIFDSWAGILNGQEYAEYVAPHSHDLMQKIQKRTPVIHFSTRTGGFLEKISKAGGDVIGVDHRIALDEAWKRIGYEKSIQGNLDPQILCDNLKQIETHVRRVLKEAGCRPGHIFNLGHGVLPETPVESAQALVDMVHEFSSKDQT